jgi:hypothetical protein
LQNPPNRCKIRQIVANRCKIRQNPPKSARIRQIVANRCKIRQNPPKSAKSLQIVAPWGYVGVTFRRFGELWGTLFAKYFEQFIDPLLYI